MTRLVAGANAPDIALPAIDGTTFKMADYLGKRVILTFFRFSSCPFCNIRINRIIKRWNEFSDDTVMVGVFDAKIGELTKRMKKHDAPFTIVADESYEHFERNSVAKTFGRFLIGALRSNLSWPSGPILTMPVGPRRRVVGCLVVRRASGISLRFRKHEVGHPEA